MENEEEYEKLREQLRQLSGSVGRMSSSFDNSRKFFEKSSSERAKAEEELRDEIGRSSRAYRQKVSEFNDVTGEAADSMGILLGNTDKLAAGFRDFGRAIPGAAVVGAIAAWTKNTVGAWRDLSNYGQMFGGSIAGLAAAAGEAGLPIDEFAASVRNSSQAMAVFGTKTVSDLMKNVRINSEQAGMFGYSIEQMNQVAGEYLNNQRAFGNRSAAANRRSEKSVLEFARQITAVAGVTGRAREQILEATNSAMRDIALTSAMIGRTDADIQRFSDSALQSATILAGLPGLAGQTFGSFLTQSTGFGTAIFADAAKTFIDGGIGQVVGSMDNLASNIRTGGHDVERATWAFLSDFRSQVEANSESLRIQAMAGNTDAKNILSMYDDIRMLSYEEYQARKEQADQTGALTAFLASVGNIFKRLFSSLLVGFFGGLENIDQKMNDIIGGDTFGKFEDAFEAAGRGIAKIFENLNEQDITNIGKGIESLVSLFLNLIKVLPQVVTAITQISDGAAKVTNLVTGGNGGGLVGLATAIIGGIVAIKMFTSWIPSLIFNIAKNVFKGFGGALFRRPMTIGRAGNASSARIPPTSRGPRGPTGEGRAPRPPEPARPTTTTQTRSTSPLQRAADGPARGGVGRAIASGANSVRNTAVSAGEAIGQRASALGRGAGRIARGAGDMARGAGAAARGAGAVGKGIGKGLIKKLPLIGLLAGLGFGASRAIGGDWTGAGLEVASGAASMLPGLGTAASIGIDGAIMARDAGVGSNLQLPNFLSGLQLPFGLGQRREETQTPPATPAATQEERFVPDVRELRRLNEQDRESQRRLIHARMLEAGFIEARANELSGLRLPREQEAPEIEPATPIVNVETPAIPPISVISKLELPKQDKPERATVKQVQEKSLPDIQPAIPVQQPKISEALVPQEPAFASLNTTIEKHNVALGKFTKDERPKPDRLMEETASKLEVTEETEKETVDLQTILHMIQSNQADVKAIMESGLLINKQTLDAIKRLVQIEQSMTQ